MLRCYLCEQGIVREDRELLAVGEPSISFDRSKDIMWKLKGTFLYDETADLLQQQLFCRLDGEDCGEFVVSSCKTRNENGQLLWDIEGCDQAVLVQRTRQESRLHAAAGTSYMELLQTLLKACGISRILCDDCDDVLATDRQWELGESTLSIVNQLLGELGFDALWFDRFGRARLSAYEALPQVSRVYRSGDLLLAPNWESRWDVHSAQNVFVAVADSPERRESWTASAVNDDPNSPISTVHLGRIMAPLIVVENAASEAALQTLVEKIRDEKLFSVQTIRFETLPQAHDAKEFIALEYQQLQALCRECRWSMEEGVMVHEVQAREVMFR